MRVCDAAPTWTARLSLAPDGTYLIAGGLGGLGVLLAELFVARGARHLVLLGRSAPKPWARAKLDALTALGAEVHVVSCDVTDRAQLGGVIANVQRSKAPLRGVIDAVGVLDDGILMQQTGDSLRRVFRPKVLGSLQLHELTREIPLDFFHLYSSITAVIGTAGQINHAGANTFLDALAHARRAQGLPALSINWGAWSEVGAAAEKNVDAALAENGTGLSHITPEEGIGFAERLFCADAPQVAVIPLVDKERAAKSLPAHLQELFAPLLGAPGVEVAKKTDEGLAEWLANFDAAPGPFQKGLLVRFLKERIGALTATDPKAIGDDQKLFDELAFDSLMALQLRNTLQELFGISLRSTLIFDYPTVEGLADYLLREVIRRPTATGAPAAVSVAESPAPPAPADIDELSTDEAALLLAAELGAA
jgi:acyl carrier protein